MHCYGDDVEYIFGDNGPVDKQECIGHYQNRVGCRLRKLRAKEGLGGKKKLTDRSNIKNYTREDEKIIQKPDFIPPTTIRQVRVM